MRIGLWSVALVAAVLPVAAQAMTVETFLAKAKALQAQGMLAMTSSDLPLIRAEVKDAGAAYRAQIEADRAAGKPPRACPPPIGQAKIDSTVVMAEFGAIPPAKRSISVKAAFYAMMDRRFACKGALSQ